MSKRGDEPAYPQVGDYAMRNESIVRIVDVNNFGRLHIAYVQIHSETDNVIGGGASFWWPRSDFRTITDPILLTAAKQDAAQRHLAQCKHQQEDLELEIRMWKAARKALREVAELAKENEHG